MQHDARISALLSELSVHERLTYLCYSLSVDAREHTIENLIAVAESWRVGCRAIGRQALFST